MYKRIMVPVDLAHTDRLEKALDTARNLARHYSAELIYVSVAAAAPSSIAKSPEEFKDKLEVFARDHAGEGIDARAHSITSHDPSVDLDPTLLKAVDALDADLVVIASHIPSLTDYIWPSNGGTIAGHAKVSVMVVR